MRGVNVCVAGSKVPVSPRGSTEGTNSSAGLQSVLLDQPVVSSSGSSSSSSTASSAPAPSTATHNGKKTTFAALPQTTTTWQQQTQATLLQADTSSDTESTSDAGVMGSQLLNVRLKLEEKRRHIESEKRRMESVMNRQRQKLGKAAFFQAVTKVRDV
ncbi:hypothetical protein J6590_063362 [Homalodisca vitripennis]|nr:hypothetical protein J6590_063362 [Homalodisca vitripennis]